MTEGGRVPSLDAHRADCLYVAQYRGGGRVRLRIGAARSALEVLTGAIGPGCPADSLLDGLIDRHWPAVHVWPLPVPCLEDLRIAATALTDIVRCHRFAAEVVGFDELDPLDAPRRLSHGDYSRLSDRLVLRWQAAELGQGNHQSAFLGLEPSARRPDPGWDAFREVVPPMCHRRNAEAFAAMLHRLDPGSGQHGDPLLGIGESGVWQEFFSYLADFGLRGGAQLPFRTSASDLRRAVGVPLIVADIGATVLPAGVSATATLSEPELRARAAGPWPGLASAGRRARSTRPRYLMAVAQIPKVGAVVLAGWGIAEQDWPVVGAKVVVPLSDSRGRPAVRLDDRGLIGMIVSGDKLPLDPGDVAIID